MGVLIVFTLLNRVPSGKFNRVNNKMGFGFLESVYEKCMLIELRKANLDAEPQKSITVYYDNQIVGEFVADSQFWRKKS